jgi:hypothetical protein
MRAVFALLSILSLAPAMPAATPPPVPSDYQAIYNQISQILTQFETAVDAKWDGTKTGVNLADESMYGSSNNGLALFDSHNIQEMQTEIARMKKMGLDTVSLSVHFPYLYQPFWQYAGTPDQYQQFAQYYAQVANLVRSQNMKLLIETQTIFADNSDLGQTVKNYYATLDWNTYMQARSQTAVNIANLMKPDYYTLISEPDTEATLTGQTNLNTVQGVIQILQPMATTIKGLNIPNMKVGGGSGTWMKNYAGLMPAILQQTPVDYYSLHIYPVQGTFLPNAVQTIQTATQLGKKVAIGETWSYKQSSYEYGRGESPFDIFRRDPYSFWQPIDSQALRCYLKLANWGHMYYMSAFWTRYLFAYVEYNDSTANLPPDQMDQLAHDTAETAMNAGQFTQTGIDWSGYVKGTIPLK